MEYSPSIPIIFYNSSLHNSLFLTEIRLSYPRIPLFHSVLSYRILSFYLPSSNPLRTFFAPSSLLPSLYGPKRGGRKYVQGAPLWRVFVREKRPRLSGYLPFLPFFGPSEGNFSRVLPCRFSPFIYYITVYIPNPLPSLSGKCAFITPCISAFE